MTDDNCIQLDYPKSADDFTAQLNGIDCSTDECTTVVVEKCPSTGAASELISSEWFRSAIVQKIPLLLAIRLKVHNGFDAKQTEKLKQHEFADRATLVVSFESKCGSQVIVCWKNLRSHEFLELQMTEEHMGAAAKLLVLDFITSVLSEGKAVTTTGDITSLISSSYHNPLFLAVQKQDLLAVRDLLKLSFDVNEDFWDELDGFSLKMVDKAWSDKNMDITLELLKASSLYPASFEKASASDGIRDHLKTSEDLHEAIAADNRDKVIAIVDKNPDQRHYFSSDNCSALNRAFHHQNRVIFDFLVERCKTFGPNENLSEVPTEEFRNRMCGVNTKFAKNLPEHHILLALSKVLMPRSDPQFDQRLRQLKEAFETINDIPEVKLILQIVTTSPRVKILVDFTQARVRYMDPTAGPHTDGLFFVVNMHLHIAARNLLKSETRKKAHGVMAHEPGHCSMHLVFRNKRLPYAQGDEVNEAKFKLVLAECERLKDFEPIIQAVFGYKSETWARELIVRVPHMLAEYQDDETKLLALRATFEPLFSYYTEVVVPAMTAALPVLAKLSSPLLTLRFSDLTEPLKAAVMHAPVKFQGSGMCFKDVTDHDDLKGLKHEQIRKILDTLNHTEVFFKELKASKDFYLSRKFIDFDFEGDIYGNKYLMEYSRAATDAMRDIDALMDEASDTKVCLMADCAGAGKSTTMRHLSVVLKERNSKHFVAVVDLKQHLHVYEKFGDKMEDLSVSSGSDRQRQSQLLCEALLEIVGPAAPIEKVIFRKLFASGRVIVLFDAMDEIAPKFTNFFFKLIGNIKALTGNQQWIATRPQHIEHLMLRLSHKKAYRLMPFDKAATDEFIGGHLASKEASVVRKIGTHLKSISNDSISNPLMLKFIVELYVAGKLSTKQFNRHILYTDMGKMKLEILSDKGRLMQADRDIDGKMTAWEVHTVYALLLFFEELQFRNHLTPADIKFISLRAFPLFRRWSKVRHNWSSDAIARYGIAVILNFGTDSERPAFVHRTFAEFFVAEFLFDIVEEAATADEDEITKAQFDMRMTFAAHIIGDYSGATSGIWSFVVDHLATRDIRSFTLGKVFLSFLSSREVKGFIERSLIVGHNIKVKHNLVEVMCGLLRHPQLQHENYFKDLTCFDGARSAVLSSLFNDFLCTTEYISLFAVCCNSGIDGWHRLTGFGKNLTEIQLMEIERLNCDDLLPQVKLNEPLDEQNCYAKPLLQLLSFILLANDIPSHDLNNFLKGFVLDYSLLTLRSSSLTVKLFEISERHFHDSRDRFTTFIVMFLEHLRKQVEKLFFCDVHESFLHNFNNFFLFLKTFLNNDQALTERALRGHSHILLLALAKHSTAVIDLYTSTFSKEEICKMLYRDLSVNIGKVFAPHSVSSFDELIGKVTGSFGSFKFFFNYSHDVHMRKVLSELSGRGSDWLALTGYELKSGKLLRRMEESKNEDEAYLYQITHLIYNAEIPREELGRFLRQHLTVILKIALTSNKLALVKLVFETVDDAFKDAREAFAEILKTATWHLVNWELLSRFTDDSVVEYFYSQLAAVRINAERSVLGTILLNEYDAGCIHVLLLEIRNDRKAIVSILRSSLGVEDILGIFVRQIRIIQMCEDASIFASFFMDLYESHHSAAFTERSFDLVRHSTDDCGRWFEMKLQNTQITGQLLNFISQTQVSHTLLEKLLKSGFEFIFEQAFHCPSLIEISFEILKGNFSDDRSKSIEIILSHVTSNYLYNPLESKQNDMRVDFKSLVKFYWSKFHEFFASDRELMRGVLMKESANRHPLILSIYYDIDNVIGFYFEYCEPLEILRVFATNVRSIITSFYDRDAFNTFLRVHFMSDEENKAAMREFLKEPNGNGRTVISEIEHEIERLVKGYSVREKTVTNAYCFKVLLTDIATELGVMSEMKTVVSVDNKRPWWKFW